MLQKRGRKLPTYYIMYAELAEKLIMTSILAVKVIDIWKIMCNFAFAFCGNESARRIIN